MISMKKQTLKSTLMLIKSKSLKKDIKMKTTCSIYLRRRRSLIMCTDTDSLVYRIFKFPNSTKV
jgi:hypothetical protein